jgi:protein-tyrosine phosphatase
MKKQFPHVRSTVFLFLLMVVSATCTLSAQTPGSSLGLKSLPNCRDLGGYKTKDSLTIKRGLLYRCSQLYKVSEEDKKKLEALKLKTDFDLRTAREREAKPDEISSTTKNISLDMLADASEEAYIKIDEVSRDPKRVSRVAGGGTAEVETAMKQIYCDMVTLPSSKKALSEFLSALAKPSSAPALFHCSSGKDRTGWATAVLLTVLGVPKEQIIKDFEKSNDYILPAQKTVIENFVKAGGEPGIMPAILGVKAIYLEAAFAEATRVFGSMDRYLTEGLGIDAVKQKAIRDAYLEKK